LNWYVAVAALHGHAPDDAREWPFADLQRLALAHELMLTKLNPFTETDG